MSPRHDAFIGGGRLALSSLVGLTGAEPESRTTWIHVAPFGEWGGHSEGKFSLTREFFDSCVAQLAGKRTPVSLDYEHASIRPGGEPTPAAGYALSAEIRGDGSSPSDGLYALVEFTTRAADFIRKGEYRFCSGVFRFDSPDGKTGAPIACALDTIALTNRPFIDGQKPIALSRTVPLSTGVRMEIDMKALAKLLDAIPGPTTADKIKKALDLMTSGEEPPAVAAAKDAEKVDASKRVPLSADAVALTDAPAVALADPAAVPLADPPMPMADVPPVEEMPAEDDIDARFMAATGLDEAGFVAALDANFDAIVSILLGNASTAALSRDLETTGLRTKLDAATVELNAFRADAAKRHDAAVTAEVEAAVTAGKWLPSQKTVALTMARKDLAGFRALTATQPVNPLLQPHATAHPAPLGQSENTDGKLPKDHPRVVATSKALHAMRIGGLPLPKELIDAKLAEMTG